MAMSHPYLTQQQFPAALQAANIPLNPATYAHLLSQQQLSQQQGPFSFMNQGKNVGQILMHARPSRRMQRISCHLVAHGKLSLPKT